MQVDKFSQVKKQYTLELFILLCYSHLLSDKFTQQRLCTCIFSFNLLYSNREEIPKDSASARHVAQEQQIN